MLSHRSHTRNLVGFLATAALGLVLTSCSSGSGSSASSTTTTTHPARQGTASVAYAASLLNANEKTIGPDFHKATGYSYTGRGAESLAISSEIAAGTITPGVFESVGAAPITPLEPKFTSWYASFASSPIVIAYNPSGPYATAFKQIADGKEPIEKVFPLMTASRFRLGRTDPTTDPQGRAFLLMLQLAEQQFGVSPATVASIVGGPGLGSASQIYSETSLDAHLEAGQLDAVSAYRAQAVQQHIPYISLPSSINLGDPSKAAEYGQASITLANGKTAKGAPLVLDITTISGPTGPDKVAAEQFVAYVLSAAGRALYEGVGYAPVPVTIVGNAAAVPAVIRAELPKRSKT